MTAIQLGVPGALDLDLDLLMRTRLLVQASSGGGKSWCLRRLAEEAFGHHIPHVIIDPEGEFSTLRERFDFLIVGKGGDTAASIRTAPLLARRILESGISAVCDIFELSPPDRARWVAAFLGALDTAPKELWRDLIVTVDEAHMFAPEKGKGESVALEAVMALATRGRKRGYCAVLATQRLGKLNKDVAAELQNVLIGRTTLDTDRDRAAEALGIGRSRREGFDRTIKKLDAGTFYALGRAIIGADSDPVLAKVGGVSTTHPEPGKRRAATPPPPTSVIRDLLARKFADLPAEADRQESTEAELRREVAELRHKNAILIREPGPPKEVRVEVIPKRVHKQLAAFEHQASLIERALESLGVTAASLQTAIGAFGRELAHEEERPAIAPKPDKAIAEAVRGLGSTGFDGAGLAKALARAADPDPGRNGALNRGALRLLGLLKERHPDRLTSKELAVLAVMTPDGGTFKTYMGKLAGLGYIDRDRGSIGVTAKGRAVATPIPPIERRALLTEWQGKLTGRARDILESVAVEHEVVGKDLAERFKMTTDGGTWKTYVGKIIGLGLVTRGRGTLRIHPELAL